MKKNVFGVWRTALDAKLVYSHIAAKAAVTKLGPFVSKFVCFGPDGANIDEDVKSAPSQVESNYRLLTFTENDLAQTKSGLVCTMSRMNAALVGKRQAKKYLCDKLQGKSVAFNMAVTQRTRSFYTQLT